MVHIFQDFLLESVLKREWKDIMPRKPSQFFYGEYEDNDPTPSTSTNILSHLLGNGNDVDKRTIAQLKAELDLRKREEALEMKQRILEQNEKKMGQNSGPTRATSVHELLEQLCDEELAAIKAVKSGFN